MPSAPLVVVESIDAGGSSSQVNRLVRHLRREGYTPSLFHFPQTDQPTGQLIYEKFLRVHNRLKLTRREQALLYIQDFYATADKIRAAQQPRAGQHPVVICDRYYTSTLAYQTIGLTGARRRAQLTWLEVLCHEGKPSLPPPHLIMFIDTPPAVSEQHLQSRTRDYFENLRKQQAVRRSYLALARQQRWIVINGADNHGRQRSLNDIHADIWQHISPLLKR